MRFQSIGRLLLGLVGLVAIAISAGAEGRGALPGYGDIRFGMSESELRSKVAVVRSHDDSGGGVWLKATDLVEITGPKFVLAFLVDHGVVKRISLLRIAAVGPESCRKHFDAMVKHVAVQYGPADTSETPGISGGQDSYKAIFRFADGASIQINSDLDADGKACFDSIVHFAPPTLDQG